MVALIRPLMIAELIIHCQSERIAPLLSQAFISAASFQQQASSVDRRAYFQRNFSKIMYDFARYGGSERLFRLFLEDPESSIVFAFEDFITLPSRQDFEQMIKRATEKPLAEVGKEVN